MRGEWSTNANGNKVLLESGSLLATVFENANGAWGSYINGQLLAGAAETAEDMMGRVQDVLCDPASARYVAPKNTWQTTKNGQYYKRSAGGILSVKLAKSGKWYATSQDGVLPHGDKPRWFATADEARRFADKG